MNCKKAINQISLIIAFLYSLTTTAQEPWRHKVSIQSCLSITFPAKPAKLDTLNFLISSTSFNSNEYQALYARGTVNVKRSRDFELALKGYVEGYCKSENMQKYSHTVADTVFGGAKGKFITSAGADKGYIYAYVYNFVTNIDGHFFAIRCATNCSDQTCIDTNVVKFYRSIEFNASCLANQFEDDELYNKSYKFGQYLGGAAMISLLIGVIVLVKHFVKKRS